MSEHRFVRAAIAAVLAGALVGSPALSQSTTSAENTEYNPTINPADFVPNVAHKYFTLKPGTKLTYKNQSFWGTERIEIAVTREIKKCMGVTTTVVRVREWWNDKLTEETRDWYAQDKEGNVWYFGEAVDNYKDGVLTDHRGSWEAGIDGAKPGIIMLKDPKVGDVYRQEYYKGRAEDMGTVVALGKKISVPHGTYENCVQIRDWSPLESGSEYKYYCPGVGFLVLEEPALLGMKKTELVSVSTD